MRATALQCLAMFAVVTGCGGAAAGAHPAESAEDAEIGPPVVLTEPVTLEQIETLAVTRRAAGGAEARSVRWEVARLYAKYVAETLDQAEMAEAVRELGRIDDALRGRIARGVSPALDARRTALWIAEWREYAAAVDLELKASIRGINVVLRRPQDAVIGPPAMPNGARITMSRDDMLRDAMTARAASMRPVITTMLEAKMAIVEEAASSWRRIERDALPAAADVLARQSAEYEAGRAPLTDLETAVRGIWRIRAIRVHMLEQLFTAIADVDQLVGHPLPLAALDASSAPAAAP